MSDAALSLNNYQSIAITTDRTRGGRNSLDLPILGLFGEVGSLLSEVKKKQRDFQSYLGFEASVIEEMGDVLWYLAIIAHHSGLSLASLGAIGERGHGDQLRHAPFDLAFAQLQPQQTLPLVAPTVKFERTLLQLAGEAGALAAANAQGELEYDQDALARRLGKIFELLLAAANEAGITLEEAAGRNLHKAVDRWPVEREFPPYFDEKFPPEEQLPRSLNIEIFERKSNNGKNYVLQRCNGIFIGDRLTDNIMKHDDYRFHDAFHYAYAAILGWSPVIRSLFRLKRKSQAEIDEGQDGARAALIEEGVATYVFGVAKQLDFFDRQKSGDLSFTFLKSVRQFVRGYESERCPLWLWEEAILKGNEAFRFLREKRRGRLVLDMKNRDLRIEELPE